MPSGRPFGRCGGSLAVIAATLVRMRLCAGFLNRNVTRATAS